MTVVDSEGNDGGLEVKLRFLEGGAFGLGLCDPGFDMDVEIRSPNGLSGWCGCVALVAEEPGFILSPERLRERCERWAGGNE